MSEYLKAAFLGIVEGLTEFLPVSSTAHLLVLTDVIDFNGPANHTFEIFIQLGAILAIVFLYREKLWLSVTGLTTKSEARHFCFILCLGTIPALCAGAIGHSFIKENFYNKNVIATALIFGGIIMLVL